MYYPRGIREASGILSKSDKFLIYYDPDIDGAVSGDLVRRFLTAFKKPFNVYINENRAHGFKIEDKGVQHLKGYTVILVDAQISVERMKEVLAQGVNIINIDHHELREKEFVHLTDPITGCEGVIINNQYPFEPQEMRYLSGAGVVYYVLKAIAPTVFTDDEKALVGLSLLSDIRPIDNPYAKDFLHTTYTHQSPLMDYLVEVVRPQRDFGFGKQTFDRNYIDFTFSPKVNALFRLNKGYDAINLFSGNFSNYGDLDVYRNVQNAMVGEIIDNMQGETLSNLAFNYVMSDTVFTYTHDVTNFIGLACSKVKNNGKTTFMFVKENGKVKRGSVRGLCDDVDYLSIFRQHGFHAEGHKNAFGVISVDLETVDIQALNQTIAQHEAGYTERKYINRLVDVSNMAFFLKSQYAKIADHNNYVRDHQRIFIRYTGQNVEKRKKGKAIEFFIDNVRAVCFDPELELDQALILPVLERGSYINLYVSKY